MPKMESEDSLAKLRRQIREIDSSILDMIARRQEMAKRVGEHKLARNIPIKDDQVEKEVLRIVRARAQELGMYEDLAEGVFRTLIEFSCKVQEDCQLRAQEIPVTPRNILIAGGLGGMGQWFAHFFSAHGHKVTLYDIRPVEGGPFRVVQDLKAGLAGVDVVVLATPVSVASALIDSIAAHKSTALVFDACSIKTPLKQAFQRAHQAGIRLTSIHPMFGPQIKSLAGRHIIFCETGDKKWSEEAASLFRSSPARLKFMPLERHDDYMAYVLGLSHLCNLVFAGTLSKSKYTFAELSEVASTTFSGQCQVSGNVVSESPELYYEIQAENIFTPSVVRALRETVDQFTGTVVQQDGEKFKLLMEKCREYFQLPLKKVEKS